MTLSSSKVVGVVLALVVGGVVYALWPSASDSPEEQIRRKVIQMSRSAEKKDLGFVLEQVSDKFRTTDGWTKQELRGFLASQILRGNWVRVFVVDTKVRVVGDTADFSGKFVFGRSEAASLENLARESVMGSYRVDAALTRESDGEWRFTGASWHPESAF